MYFHVQPEEEEAGGEEEVQLHSLRGERTHFETEEAAANRHSRERGGGGDSDSPSFTSSSSSCQSKPLYLFY